MSQETAPLAEGQYTTTVTETANSFDIEVYIKKNGPMLSTVLIISLLQFNTLCSSIHSGHFEKAIQSFVLL